MMMTLNGWVFQRTKKDGTKSGTYTARYRTWDIQRSREGRYRDRTTGERVRRRAESRLESFLEEEEAKRLGRVPLRTNEVLKVVVAAFLEHDRAYDRRVESKNRRGVHPVDGSVVRGTSWFIRKLDFADALLGFYGPDAGVTELEKKDLIEAFDRHLNQSAGRKGEGWTRSTRHKVLTWVRRLCRWAKDRAYVTASPFEGPNCFRIPTETVQKQCRVLTLEEERAFMAEVRALPLRTRVRIRLLLATAGRATEINTIRARDVDFERKTVTRHLVKGHGSSEACALPVRVDDALLEDLRCWLEQSQLEPEGLLFGGALSQVGVKFLRRWNLSSRSLRRTVLTKLVREGANLATIQHVAGHQKLTTTQKYLAVSDEDVSAALQALTWGEKHDGEDDT